MGGGPVYYKQERSKPTEETSVNDSTTATAEKVGLVVISNITYRFRTIRVLHIFLSTPSSHTYWVY